MELTIALDPACQHVFVPYATGLFSRGEIFYPPPATLQEITPDVKTEDQDAY